MYIIYFIAYCCLCVYVILTRRLCFHWPTSLILCQCLWGLTSTSSVVWQEIRATQYFFHYWTSQTSRFKSYLPWPNVHLPRPKQISLRFKLILKKCYIFTFSVYYFILKHKLYCLKHCFKTNFIFCLCFLVRETHLFHY